MNCACLMFTLFQVYSWIVCHFHAHSYQIYSRFFYCDTYILVNTANNYIHEPSTGLQF